MSDFDTDVDYLIELQTTLQQVCRSLNALDWTEVATVTDDFVIAPADGSQYFGGYEDWRDLANSIPPARLKLLQDQKLLGPTDQWYCLPDEKPTD